MHLFMDHARSSGHPLDITCLNGAPAAMGVPMVNRTLVGKSDSLKAAVGVFTDASFIL